MTVGHGVYQGAVGDVIGGIANREQKIGPERPGNFHVWAHVWHGKRQDADNRKRHGSPELPRAKAAPAAAGSVSNNAHNRV